jgi:cytoskeletal protein CcmA (bactofilin family)
MSDKKRIDRVELGVFDRGKAIDIYAKEFICTAAGKIQGDLDSETAEVRGACKIGGDVRTAILKIGGSMKVVGNVRAELIRAKGAFKVEGNVNANNFRIAGATKVLGKIISTEEIFIQGVLKCMSDIDAVKFNLHGVADVEGCLKAKEFTAELSGKSAIKYLDSELIRVKISQKANDSELLVKKITGKDIYLEATVAELVEGDKVVIGKNCTIKEVKANTLDVHKGSKVGKRL